jgi:hypothetical protein
MTAERYVINRPFFAGDKLYIATDLLPPTIFNYQHARMMRMCECKHTPEYRVTPPPKLKFVEETPFPHFLKLLIIKF